MQLRSPLRALSLLSLLAAILPPGSARAQYGGVGPGSTQSMISSAEDTSVQSRYSKAVKGKNLNEWVRRLNEDDPVRRLDAVKSLGDSNDPKAVDYLIQAVGDADPRVEAKAVDYLGKLHAADSTPFLIQKLFTVGTRQQLRHRILMTLGKIGDPRASKPILQYVMQAEDLDTRGAGIYAIGEIADNTIHDELKRFSEIENDPRLKRLADDALVKIATRQPPPAPKDPSAFPTALEAALSRESPQ
jgi:HEAT repeat protein